MSIVRAKNVVLLNVNEINYEQSKNITSCYLEVVIMSFAKKEKGLPSLTILGKVKFSVSTFNAFSNKTDTYYIFLFCCLQLEIELNMGLFILEAPNPDLIYRYCSLLGNPEDAL